MLLRTLGGLALSGASFRRPKPLLLLAYLALEGPKERRYLADLFWMGSANPRQSLSAALSQLRKGAPGAVEVEGTRLRSHVECDAYALLLAAADERWHEVLRLYAGTFLEGTDVQPGRVELEEWVYGTRETLNSRVREALVATAEAHAASSDLDEARRLAERAYSMSEIAGEADVELFGRLGHLLNACGSPCARKLPAEAARLGLDPSSVETAAAGSRSRAAVADAGDDGGFPTFGTSIVGRQEEASELLALLEGHARLVTLVGLGGMGKTRLAVSLAKDALDRGTFPRAYFVPLESVRDARDVPLRIAAALRVRAVGVESVVDALIRAIGQESMLLVLDNLDGLTAVGEDIVALLRSCPALRVLATSREPLALTEEHLRPVGGLSLPDGRRDALVRSTYFDALQLFVRQARRVDPGFGLGSDNAGPIVEICRLVDGSPLGIEMAAGLVRTLTAQELLDALHEGLDVLTSRERDRPERHASLRVVFEHGWRSLLEPQQEVLKRLAVFRGGFTRHTAAVVAGATVPVLSALVDRSLIRRRQGRFELHPLVREFVNRKSMEDPEARGEVQMRHAEAFATSLESFSRRATDHAATGAQRSFGDDFENVALAWRWAVESRRFDLLERMAPVLYMYLDHVGRHAELAGMVDHALTFVSRDSFVGAHLLRTKVLVRPPYDPDAFELAQEVLETFRVRGSPSDVAEGLNEVARRWALRGNLEEARRLWREALELFRSARRNDRAAACLGNLAMMSNDAREQLQGYEDALALSRAAGDGNTWLHESLAQAVVDTYGDYRRAIAMVGEALTIERALRAKTLRLPSLLGTEALLRLHLGEPDEAEGRLARAESLLADRTHWRVDALEAALDIVKGVLHYVRGESSRARAIAARHRRRNTSLTLNLDLLLRLALDEDDGGAVEHLLAEAAQVAADGADTRHARMWRAKYHLYSSEAAHAGSTAAQEHLAAALCTAADDTFVPLALEGLVTAASWLPEEEAASILSLAVGHPASSCFTRKRAAARASRSPSPATPASMSDDDLLEIASRLGARLRA